MKGKVEKKLLDLAPGVLECYIGPVGRNSFAKYNDRLNKFGKYEKERGVNLAVFYPQTDKDERYREDNLKLISENGARNLVEYIGKNISFNPNNAEEFYKEAVKYDAILLLGLEFVKDKRIVDYFDKLFFKGAHIELVYPDVDCNRNPVYPHVTARATRIKKYVGHCVECGREGAVLTQRKENGVATGYGREPFEKNVNFTYEAVCPVCHELPGAPWEEFYKHYHIKDWVKNNDIEIGKLIGFVGLMRTRKTGSSLRLSESLYEESEILRLKSDKRDVDGFVGDGVEERGSYPSLRMRREAYPIDVDIDNPISIYEDEKIQQAGCLVVDEAQFLDSNYAIVLEALRMGGANGKPKDIIFNGILLNYLGELFSAKTNPIPFLINDATKIGIGRTLCQYPFSEEENKCMNIACRDLLVVNSNPVNSFSCKNPEKIEGDKLFNNACIEHTPLFVDRPEFLKRTDLKRG